MAEYRKKKFIYYTIRYDENNRVIDERLAFSPNQYVQLKAKYGNDIVCVRMDLVTGEWKAYPLTYARK